MIVDLMQGLRIAELVLREKVFWVRECQDVPTANVQMSVNKKTEHQGDVQGSLERVFRS